ncbi:hypothetical protein ACP70R_020875 [Stipagrostis hirtigluma subsp. patula]
MAEISAKMKVEFINQDESVQVVADTIRSSGEVPERYVRPEVKADPVIIDTEGYNLPIIDMSRLLNPEFSEEETAKLGSACEHWGFFQLVNHGVDGGLLQKIKADITEFFNLPLEEKLAIAIPPNGMQGFGHHFVFSKEQKLDWVDLLFLATRPVEERNLAFWPTKPSTFRVLGLSPHSDAAGLTVLLQSKDVQGLQVKRDGKWFAVDALDGVFIVNVGDTLEILSNGKFRSAEHRAVVNPNKERISVAMFHHPCRDWMLSPLPEFVKDDKVRYRSTRYPEFLTQYLKAKLDGKNHLEILKLE